MKRDTTSVYYYIIEIKFLINNVRPKFNRQSSLATKNLNTSWKKQAVDLI